MHSGMDEDGTGMILKLEDFGRQLVKTEWDAAEAWLQEEEDNLRINP